MARTALAPSPPRPLRTVFVRPLCLVMQAVTNMWTTPHEPSAWTSFPKHLPFQSRQLNLEKTPTRSSLGVAEEKSLVSERSSGIATALTAPTGRADTVVVGMRSQRLSLCIFATGGLHSQALCTIWPLLEQQSLSNRCIYDIYLTRLSLESITATSESSLSRLWL